MFKTSLKLNKEFEYKIFIIKEFDYCYSNGRVFDKMYSVYFKEDKSFFTNHFCTTLEKLKKDLDKYV